MKAQISLEFLIMIGIAALFLLIFMGIAYNIFEEKIYEGRAEQVKDLGYALQSEIITAHEVHDGYSRNISIPKKLDGLDYTITNQPTYIVISYARGDITFKIPEVSGTLHKGTVTISKVNGNVQII